jgi:hypothetical protein
MGISKNKTGAIAIALLLILSMSASMMLVPSGKAASSMNVPDFAYIAVSTNPCGVGQTTEVIMWMNQVIFGAAFGNNIRFQNYHLIITAPDGTNTTVPFAVVSDPTSAQDYYFTPTAVGTYTLTFNFPGQVYNFPIVFNPIAGTTNAAYEGATYLPASASCTLTVQSATVPPLPSTPLPTAFWTRPIYGENSNWFTIASNWLGDIAPGYTGFAGSYNGGGNGEQLAGASDVVGSLTSHVMWTKPIDSGGIVGNNQTLIQGDSYFDGSAYNQRFTDPIIVDGMLFYTEPVSFDGVPGALSNTWGYGPVDCVNLATGQLMWSKNITAPSFAYVYDVQDANQHGVYPPILFSVAGGLTIFGWVPMTWTAYDAYTGDYMFTVSNIPVGDATTTALGPNGEFLIIDLVNLGTPTSPNWYLQEWNSSRMWTGQYNGESTSPEVVPPYTVGSNPILYDYNVSVPFLDSAYGMLPIKEVGAIVNNVLLAYSGNLPSLGADFMGPQSDTPYTYFTLNIDQATPASLGTVIWHQTETPPPGNITVLEQGIDPVNRVFVEDYRETQQYVGYSLDTGAKLWGPTVPQAQLDYYGSSGSGSLAGTFAYGKLYSSAYAGIVYCYDTKTGDILWTYGNGGEGNNSNSGVETPFAHYPTFVNAIGGGVVYLVTTEHTEESPIFKGAVASAINATTGKLIWQLSDYTGEFLTMSYAAADGYCTWFNSYDAQIYTVGRGPSQTTVDAGPKVTTFGDNVVISGTVMDISAGTKQAEQAADFPNGVPCASDASMTQWMGYVYQQQPEPTNFTGVPVTIAVTDSNHNCYDIGTVTTDAHGFYTLTWTPDITGNYTVTATFAGTLGYWPSSAETSFNVMSAPPTPAPTAAPPTGLASTGTVELGIAAVIIVIIIIGIVLAVLTIRRRP